VGTQTVTASDLDNDGNFVINSNAEFSSIQVEATQSNFVIDSVSADSVVTGSSETTYEYSITLNAGLTDTDGSESLSSITVNNLPNGATIDGITANADGSYTVPVDENGDASVTLTSSTEIPQSDLDSITSSVTSTEENGGESATVEATSDTFTMGDDDFNLDFDNVADDALSNLNSIDLTDGDHNITNLELEDVLSMTDDDNTLTIFGDSGDNVELTNSDGNEWIQSTTDGTPDTTEIDGHTFVTFSNNDASILIEQDVPVTMG